MRGALLLLPFIFLLIAELFILPIDFFTFRIWEAVLAEPFHYPGPFYPNLHVRKDREFGDRYRSSDPSQVQSKPVEWFTDGYGWRNRPEIEKRESYDIVVLGDSNIVGGFLDQKDTISEVLSARSGKTAYSYSIGHDKISMFFSDPRMVSKAPKLLVVESKILNWTSNDSGPVNFRELPDGSLDIVDRSREFATYLDPKRNPALEQIESRLTKQAMFHWLKASLASEFNVHAKKTEKLFFGRSNLSNPADKAAWRPFNWSIPVGISKPLADEIQPALTIRAKGQTFWKTESFVSSKPDGKIVVRFEARNTVSPTKHRLWIFEDGAYRSVGEFVAQSRWQAYEVPIAANRGSTLEFQIDQADDWQWLSLRNFHVIGATSLPLKTAATVPVPMAGWTGAALPCKGESGDCRQWSVDGKSGYVQSPVLPPAGDAGLLVRFAARSDRPAGAFTPVYLFEGERYRAVAQYAFGPEWQEFGLLLKPDGAAPLKLQVDFPNAAGLLLIRDFQAVPVGSIR